MRLSVAVTLCASVALAEEGPTLIQIPKQRSVKNTSVLCEIVSYSVEPPFGNAHGRATNAHETAHGIHATYRNEHIRLRSGEQVNAVYMGDGKIAVIREPEFLIKHIEVPQCLRGYRHELYFVQQLQYWNEQPLYIFDEWVAYICGAECAVDDFETCGLDTKEDSVSGSLEFSIYAVATYLAAKARDPDYLDREPQFRRVLGYTLKRAEQVFYDGRDVFPSKKQDDLYEALQSHPDARPIRDCLRSEFGGAFLIAGEPSPQEAAVPRGPRSGRREITTAAEAR